ncbi:hypothetical protein ACLOJK_032504 [Asimina triloba]
MARLEDRLDGLAIVVEADGAGTSGVHAYTHQSDSRETEVKFEEFARRISSFFQFLMSNMKNMSKNDKLFNFMARLQSRAQKELRWHGMKDLASVVATVENLINYKTNQNGSEKKNTPSNFKEKTAKDQDGKAEQLVEKGQTRIKVLNYEARPVFYVAKEVPLTVKDKLKKDKATFLANLLEEEKMMNWDIPKPVRDALVEFEDVMLPQFPRELPPKRHTEHTIELMSST